MKRLIVYAKDLAELCGKSERHGYDKLKKIRQHSNKTEKWQEITIYDVAGFFGIDSEKLFQWLNSGNRKPIL